VRRANTKGSTEKTKRIPKKSIDFLGIDLLPSPNIGLGIASILQVKATFNFRLTYSTNEDFIQTAFSFL